MLAYSVQVEDANTSLNCLEIVNQASNCAITFLSDQTVFVHKRSFTLYYSNGFVHSLIDFNDFLLNFHRGIPTIRQDAMTNSITIK